MIKGVKRIVVLQRTEDDLQVVGEYQGPQAKRKRSKKMKRSERNQRHIFAAWRAYVDELEARHEKSTRKRKDGWIFDAGANRGHARRKAVKELRKIQIL
jgi:hypothetical protein